MRIHRDERGAALAIVMLVGVVLVMLSSIMVARGYRQLVNTSNDTHWDDALFAAEAGLDDALVLLDQDFGFDSGETIPDGTLGTDAERAWAVEAADAVSEAGVVRVPEGEYVVVRPSNSTVVFAVGYSPSRAATERRVRVIRASVEGEPWEYVTEHALLVGDDLELSGNTTIIDTNDNDAADVHSNGAINSTGAYTVEGCVTASDSVRSATSVCPPSPLPPEPMPVIDPTVFYPYAHYLFCPDQVIYGGPAHATDPDPDGVPCSGDETAVALAGWTSRRRGGVTSWTTQPSATEGAVFYIHDGNFDGKLGTLMTQMEATVVVANGKGDGCETPSTGSIELSGNSNVSVHPSLSAAGFDILFVAQGDVAFKGGATVGGAIFAHEQIDYRGNAGSWGAVVAVDACDTPGSPISSSKTESLSTTTGASTINYPGPIRTPFTATTLKTVVVGWYEL